MADTNPQQPRSTGSSRKNWIKKRLLTLSELRGAKPISEDSFDAMAAQMRGFSESVIDKACLTLENAIQDGYEPRMPPLAILLDACRAASRVAQEPAKFWIWECKRCDAVFASKESNAHGCTNCGGSLVLTSRPEENFDHGSYMRDVRQHPEKYIRISDVIREVTAKRQAEGKRVWV